MNDGKQENNQASSAKEDELKEQAASQNPELIDEEPLELNVEFGAEGEKSSDHAAIEGLIKQLETVTLENKELNDKVLRVMADMENLRRRKDREIADKEKYAVSDFGKEVVSVADNIQRAIASVPPEDVEKDPSLKALLEGVQMTERELTNVLERKGIVQMQPMGEIFDPNLHQAMFEVEDLEKPAGTVMQVIQAGFTIGERTLRPAMVGVSKGGPKVAKAEAKNDEADVIEEEIHEASDSKAEQTAEATSEKSGEKPAEKDDKTVGNTVDKSA